MKFTVQKRLLIIMLLLACVVMLSSCSTVEGILRYFTSLPGNLFNAIAP